MNSASSAFAIQRSLNDVEQEFDVIIIGGGITGISVAREAASRGLKTILLERGDFGSGTSAATTKYIHGGIRYLEQYDVAVVRESLRERRILALGAPPLLSRLGSSCQRGVGANLRRRLLVLEFCYTTLWLSIEICTRQTV